MLNTYHWWKIRTMLLSPRNSTTAIFSAYFRCAIWCSFLACYCQLPSDVPNPRNWSRLRSRTTNCWRSAAKQHKMCKNHPKKTSIQSAPRVASCVPWICLTATSWLSLRASNVSIYKRSWACDPIWKHAYESCLSLSLNATTRSLWLS